MNAHRELLGVIGDPIAHSLSPLLHGYLIQRFELNCCYHAFRVRPENLACAVWGARALGFTGLNVTLPHKQQVLRYVDHLDEMAEKIGAVNTLRFVNGQIVGYNTDAVGFLQSLERRGIFLRNRQIFILGAGGAARAVAFAAQMAGAAAILIHNRSENRAVSLAEQVGGRVAAREAASTLPKGSLVVNATSVGMVPQAGETPLPSRYMRADLVYVDLVYNPVQTRFLREAASLGAHTVDGLGMLILQAVRSLQHWLQIRLSVEDFFDDIRQLLVRALQGEEDGSTV